MGTSTKKTSRIGQYLSLHKKKLYLLTFVLIFFIGFILRTYHLSSLPPALNRDETALGYNAYSLLMTGKDEHGKFFPLSLQSFGDWKLPGYSVTDIPFIAFFGLNEFAVRLPSSVAGSLSVILIYFIAKFIFNKKAISILSSFFFALSPWNIYFSRAAYEVNLGLFFFLTGLVFLLWYGESEKKAWKLLVSGVFFILPLFTYHAFILFTPLFIFPLLYLYRKKIPHKTAVFFGIIVFIFCVLGYANISVSGLNKISTLSVFSNKDIIYDRAEKLRGDSSVDNPVISHILYNKYFAGSYQVAQNYLATFSPSFLFDKGGQKTVHNLGYFGNLYVFDILLLGAGLFFLIRYKDSSMSILGLWLLVAPLPSALTLDPQNSTRFYPILPAFILIMSYGAYHLYLLLNKTRLGPVCILGLAGIFLFNVVLFLDGYFVHMNAQRARFWDYGYKQSVQLSQQYPTFQTVMRGPENFPYIYFLFYNKYDPNRFRKEVSYYPLTKEGFLYVKEFGKYSFPYAINYNAMQSGTLSINNYVQRNSTDHPIHTINLPSNEPIFIYEVKE